ncbi:MAG: fluoride efflux transporter FluC [Mycobacteriales bacterium]
MAAPSPDPSSDPHVVDALGQRPLRKYPLDTDHTASDDLRHRSKDDSSRPFAPRRRSRWPRIHWGNVGAVAVGGFLGGIARYAVVRAWPAAAGAFPWGIFLVNTTGAFILALLLVLALEALLPAPYLRPLVGTGFCGALTTFSSVATSVDQLGAHGHPDVAAGYVAGSVIAGLAAATLGMLVGRSISANRAKGKD